MTQLLGGPYDGREMVLLGSFGFLEKRQRPYSEEVRVHLYHQDGTYVGCGEWYPAVYRYIKHAREN